MNKIEAAVGKDNDFPVFPSFSRDRAELIDAFQFRRHRKPSVACGDVNFN